MIQSPCINICRMDEDNQLCQGCFRTLDEIAGWSRADDGMRAGILAAVARRRAAANSSDSPPLMIGDHHG